MAWCGRLLMSFALLLFGTDALAQSVAVTGVVLDARTDRPLAGVRVYVENGSASADTDAEGRFRLVVPPGRHSVVASVVGYAIGTASIEAGTDASIQMTIRLAEGTGVYKEQVTVVGALSGAAAGAPAGIALYGRELQSLRGLMLDDPLRALHAVPSATATDDFYSEFAVRGSTFRHVGLAVDGVPAPYLMHSVHGVTDGGSIAMVNSEVLGAVALLPGSYPQKTGRRLGAHLDLTTREGSRERFRARAGLSGTSATALLEGPIADGRGAWLVSGRRSYLDYLIKRIDADASWVFGFTDAQAQIVYDLDSRNQLQWLGIVGVSGFSEDPQTLAANDEADADSRSWLSALTWRFAPTPRLVVSQRLYFTGVAFDNRNRDGLALDAGRSSDVGWRADASLAAMGGLVEFGGEMQRLAGRHQRSRTLDGSPQSTVLGDYSDSRPAASAYAQFTMTGAAGLQLTPGARIDYSGSTRALHPSPWLTGQWPITGTLKLRGGTGVYRQFPDLEQALGVRGGGRDLRAERAVHVDAGIVQSFGATTTLQLTWFRRDEADVLWTPDAEPRRLSDGSVRPGRGDARWSNRLDGRARGVELLLRRDAPTGLSGWAGYAYGRHRYVDVLTQESFWADADQRHTLSVFGTYRLSRRSTVSAKFRYGSNYPMTGYLGKQPIAEGAPRLFGDRDVLFLGLTGDRNTLRLPAYARLDVRADRTFQWANRRVTAFVEVANALNRTNLRNVPYGVDGRGRVFGATDSLMPIVPSAGFVVEF